MTEPVEVPEGELRQVLGLFGRDCPVIRPAGSGRLHEHRWTVIANGEECVLRRFAPARTDAAIAFELAALRHASEKGWPVELPHPGPGGQAVTEVAGMRWALVPRRPGLALTARSFAERRITGSLLARLTTDMASFRWDGQRDGFGRLWELDLFVQTSGAASFNSLLADFGRIEPELAGSVRRSRYGNLRELARLGFGELPVTFVHADFQRDNLLFCDGELTALLDFDSARMDCAAADLAATLWLDCLEPPVFDRIEVEAAAAVAEAYARIRPLSADDVRLVPELIRAHMLAFVALGLVQWRAGDGNALESIRRTAEHRLPALRAVGPALNAALLRFATRR